MAKSFSVFCLYADDVRHEVNGKVSFIGTYLGDLNATAPSLPSNIARLVVAIFVNIPRDRKFKRLNFEILWDDTVLQGMNFDAGQLPAGLDDNLAPDANGHVINLIAAIEPMQLKGNGSINVKVTVDDDVVMGNKLKVNVQVAPPPS